MTRQDEFLRSLLEISRLNGNSGTQDYGLRLIDAAINERLPLLKPVVYENHDLSSGLSWSGHIICGDRASIDAVKLALHQESNIPVYQDMLRREQKAHNSTAMRASRYLAKINRLRQALED